MYKKVAKASILGLEILQFMKQNTEYFSFKDLYRDFNLIHTKIEYKYLNKALNNLNKQSLVDIESRNLAYFCKINNNGLRYLKDRSRCIGDRSLPCRTHDLLFNLQISKRGKRSFPGFKVAKQKMKNWRFHQFTKEYAEGVILQTTDKTLKMRFSNVYGIDSNCAIFIALERVLIIRDKLMQEDPELVLGSPERITSVVKQHHALNIPSIQSWLEEHYIHWKDDRIHVDKSCNYPEIEFVHSGKAQEDFNEFISFIWAIIDKRFPWRELCTED